MSEELDLASFVEGGDGISVVRGGGADPNYDFKKLETYGWMPREDLGDPRIDQDRLDVRVHAGVDGDLQNKGYRLETAAADFLVGYRAVLGRQRTVDAGEAYEGIWTDDGRPARSAGDEHPAPIADHIRLLLVDDDRDFTAALRPALERRGLDVTVAQSGTDAAGLPGRQGFDVAIVDLRMPDMDGLTLLAALKDADPALEVIVLTAHGTAESARRGLVDGAFDYLTKPQPVDVLVRRVLAAFRRRREREDDDRGGDVDRILSRYPD